MTILEADAILLAEFDIKEKRIDERSIQKCRTYDKHMIRMGQIFNRIADLVWECLATCGLVSAIVSRNCTKICRIISVLSYIHELATFYFHKIAYHILRWFLLLPVDRYAPRIYEKTGGDLYENRKGHLSPQIILQ